MNGSPIKKKTKGEKKKKKRKKKEDAVEASNQVKEVQKIEQTKKEPIVNAYKKLGEDIKKDLKTEKQISSKKEDNPTKKIKTNNPEIKVNI